MYLNNSTYLSHSMHIVFTKKNRDFGQEKSGKSQDIHRFFHWETWVGCPRLTLLVKTRFNSLAQVIEARFSAAVWSGGLTGGLFLRFPHLAGMAFHQAYYLIW